MSTLTQAEIDAANEAFDRKERRMVAAYQRLVGYPTMREWQGRPLTNDQNAAVQRKLDELEAKYPGTWPF